MSPLGHRNPGASSCSSLPEECLAQPQWATHRMDQWLGQHPGTQASCPPEAVPGQETPLRACSSNTGWGHQRLPEPPSKAEQIRKARSESIRPLGCLLHSTTYLILTDTMSRGYTKGLLLSLLPPLSVFDGQLFPSPGGHFFSTGWGVLWGWA